MVHEFILGPVNMSRALIGPVRRLLDGGDSAFDWILVFYACYFFLFEFTSFYKIVFGFSRLAGDLQQFLLSPAFGSQAREIMKTDGFKNNQWKQATILERLLRVEVTMDCLMPEGPNCPMFEPTSSSVWR